MTALDPARLADPEEAQAAWSAALPPHVALERCTAERIELRAPGDPVEALVLRRVPPGGGPRGRAFRAPARSAAGRWFHAAHRLLARGLPVARPLGFLERAPRLGGAGAGFLVLQRSFGPTLAELAAREPSPSAAWRSRALALGALYRALHAAGGFGVRLEALVEAEGGLEVADLGGLHGALLRERALHKELASLAQTAARAGLGSPRLRATFLQAYLRHAPDRRNRLGELWRLPSAPPSDASGPEAPRA